MTTTYRARARVLAIAATIGLTTGTLSGYVFARVQASESAPASAPASALAPTGGWVVHHAALVSGDQDPVFACWLEVKPNDVEPICAQLAEPADPTVACLLGLGYHGNGADHREAIYAPRGVVDGCATTVV